MRKISLAFSVLCGIAASRAAAYAQTSPPLPSQAPVPEAMPFDIPYGVSLGLAQARQVALAAAAEARKHNWKVAISIVGADGALICFEKMDGTQLASIEISPRKARTAVRFRRPTAAFYDQMETGHPFVATLDPELVASPGGRLLVAGGKIVGAIGVSGAAGVQDDVVAQAGAITIK